ncbi:MAG: SMP-30/gluconolactonase/LRE family protein [Pseudomonadota bacterium]
MEFEVVAEGLRFPEAPVVMADGSVIVVEIERKTVTRCWAGGKTEVIAEPGGGPNGLAIGPDGALYCCNNGGFLYHDMDGLLVPGHCPDDYSGGRIERIDIATGKVDRLYEEADGIDLRGPNDIVFDKAGNFYFTDLGKTYSRQRDNGGLFFGKPDGSLVKCLDYPHISPNGVGLSPDEKQVYFADTMTARLWAFDIAAPGELEPIAPPFAKGRVVAGMPELRYFDSLAVAASGNVCVATISMGGITTIQPDGAHSHIALPDPFVTNIAFGGEDMHDAYITLSGTGKLIKCRWPEAGLKLNFNA